MRRVSIRANLSEHVTDLERRTERFPRWMLSLASAAYGLATAVRNAWYDHVSRAGHACAVPVISVGNVTVGGTGKTPLVIELVTRLREAGCHPAIVTRGYAARSGHGADEVQEYLEALPETPVVVDSDRVRGVRTAAERHAADCVVLDDGFQHRRLRRDFDLVAIDALNPFGGGRLLPAGGLRESLAGLRRASFFVVTRVNLVRETDVERIRAELAMWAPQAPVLTAQVVSDGLTQVYPARAGASRTLRVVDSDAQPDPLLPVCGIGNPASVLRLLDSLGIARCEPLLFSDHHDYRTRDLDRIESAVRERGARGVATTRKDWVKLRGLYEASGRETAVFRLSVRMELENAAALVDRIVARVASREGG